MVATAGNMRRINLLLRALGREERIVRGKGYVYMIGGAADKWHEQAICSTNNLQYVSYDVALRIIVGKFDTFGVQLSTEIK